MNKEYILNGFSILVRPEDEEEFLQMNPTATLAEGNQQSSVEDATAEQQTTASTQETDQSQTTQQQDTGSQSVDTSLEFINQVDDSYNRFKANEEQRNQAQINSQKYIKDLIKNKDQDLSGIQKTSLQPGFVYGPNQFAMPVEKETEEYKNAKKLKQDSQKEFDELQQQALDRLLRRHNYESGDNIQKGTPEYDEWVTSTRPFTSIEMAKIKQEEEELSIFEDNIKDFAEENDVLAIAKGKEQKELRNRTAKAISLLDIKAQEQIKKTKVIQQNLNALPQRYQDLKNLNISLNELNNEARSILDGEYNSQEEVDKANDRLTEIKNRIDTLNSDYAKAGGMTYDQLVEFRDTNLKAFENVSRDSEDIITKQKDFATYMDAIDRDYGWAVNFGGQLAASVLSGGSAIVELGDKMILDPAVAAIDMATGPDSPDWVKPLRYLPSVQRVLLADKAADVVTDYIDNVNEDILNGLEKPITFSEIENLEDTGEWFAHLVSTQALNTAITFTTGGASLYILGGMEAGRQFKELDKEIEGGAEYTFAQYYGTALGSGLVEGVTEIPTLGAARGIKSLLKNNPEAKRGFVNTLKRNFATRKGIYKNIYEPIEEGGSELLATIGQNSFQKFLLGKEDVSLLDGGLDAFASGAVMNSVVYKSPLIGKNVVKAFQSSDTTQELADISDKIQKKTKILSEVELSPENQKALETEIVNLVRQHKKVMDESISNIDKMTPEEQRTLMDVDVAVASLKANNKSIRGEFGLTEQQIEEQVADNNAQIANLTALKNQTIANASKSENLSRVERDTDRLKKMSTKLFGKPVQVVRVNKDNVDEQLKTYKKAETDAVNKKIKTKQDQLKTAEEVAKPKIREEIKQLKADKATIKNVTKETLLGGHGANAIHADMIIVNPEFAAERGATNVVQHETMHQLLKNTLADNPRAAIALGNAVDEILAGQDPDAVAQSEMSSRLTAYAKQPQKVRAEEKVTLLMDALKSGDIKINKSLGSKLKAPIRRIIQSTGLKQGAIKLDTADDVLNFITDVNAKSNIFTKNNAFTKASLEGIKIGKELTAGVEDVQDDGSVPIKQSQEASQKVQDLYNPILELQTKEGKTEADNKMIARMKDDVSGVIAMEYRGMAENIFSRALANAQTEDIRNDLLDNKEDIVADILYDPGTETAKARTVLGLVKDFDPAKHKYQNVAAYVNQFLPQRAKEVLAKRGVQETATKSMTDEGIARQAEGVAVEESVRETGPKRKGIVLADRLKVRDKIAPKAEQYVKDNDLTGTTYKKTPNIATETVGEVMGIPAKKITSNANLSKPELANAQMFINKNADMLQSMLPEGATEDGTATGVQKVLLDQFYNKRSKRAKTKAGLATQAKRPDITRSQFLEVFGIVDGKPQRDDRNTSSRVLALAKQLDRAMSNQAIREVLMQDDTQAATVQQMASGKSPVMFSKDAKDVLAEAQKSFKKIREQFSFETKGVDKLLNAKDIDSTFNLKKPEGREQFIKSIEKHLLPIMPRGFYFGPDSTVFTASNKIYGLSMSTTDGKRKNASNEYLKPEQGYAYEEFRNRLKALKNLPDTSFGKEVKGVTDYSVSSYSTMFKNEATIKKNLANGKIKEWNKKVSAIHRAMWQRFNDAIKNDNTENKEITRTIATYLKLVANDTGHWHKLGAQFEGYTKNPKERFEFEHAMPATAAYIYLMDAALGGGDFTASYNKVIDNYKLLALDKADDKKLTKSGLQRGMPEGWSIVDNIWWDRYFNETVAQVDGGIDPNSIVLLNGKTLGNELGINSEGKSKIVIASGKEIQSKINLLSARQSLDANPKGMSTFDFDETLIIGGENFVVATDPSTNEQVKITSEEWPIKGPDYAAQGYEFDFSDFANVRGGKEGPLLQKMKNQIKKYGNENVFVLTARQQASAEPIQEWLKTQGIDLPLKNITGLGKSEGEAKAEWMLEKFAEGYNDMYFVDDAMPNVRAVKQVLDQLDIKSKVVQAKLKFSKDGNAEFNKMLERNVGVPSDKIFSDAQARIRGRKASGFKFFVPPSAEDFKGLLYNFLGKGKQGDADMQFFKEHLLDPFTKGIRDINYAKQRTSEEFKTLKKEMPNVAKRFNDVVANSDYTVNDAIRVYLWNKNDIDIPGLSEQEISLLSDYVKEDPKLRSFANTLGTISRAKEGYVVPDDNWTVGSITSDLFDQTGKINRAEYLSEWQQNIDVIFSPENLNKIQAVYGTDFREALDNMLYRMQTGNNRASGSDRVVNEFMDWINGSVGAVMFFNTRSAALQTLSTVNFIDWSDNNIFKAGKAFANQPQYWKDFITLFNSDMLKQRRAGMAIDVNLAELSNTVAKSSMRDKSKAAIRYLLQIGFTPTQIADSFAIASGGATFYRNKINKYLKEGMDQKEAETKAFDEFQEIAEETQQSSRPDLISQQQAGTLGRLILAWQNTPMQYTRLTKKAISDLVNGRGDWKSHVSRILYYGAMQNVIFGALQTGLAFLLFGPDEDDEKTQTKVTRVANGALDTLLRGTGVYGAMASTLKNTIMKYMDERDKPYGKRELSKVALEAVQLSPPIGSKLRKIMSGIYSYEYNKGVPEKMGLSIDNPILNVVGNLVEATTNIPLARAVRKAQNLEEAINGNHETWKRVALIGGWDKWSLDVKDEELEKAKEEVKIEKKQKKEAERKIQKEEDKKAREEQKKLDEENERKDKEAQGIKEVRCSGIKSNGERCKIVIETKEKTALCGYHKSYKPNEGSDRDGDGIKEYQCKATTSSGRRCKNRTENTNKKCYAHQ
jgi:hypothetical protein